MLEADGTTLVAESTADPRTEADPAEAGRVMWSWGRGGLTSLPPVLQSAGVRAGQRVSLVFRAVVRNTAPAADVGVAMNTGTQAARAAGNMVDLDNNPTKLIEIVGLGKQLLMTRGALTTFSISNDVAKYFAILPAIFVALYPGLGALNVMGLTSPQSAILSAVIFNALIIPFLVPLALRGVAYKPRSASRQLIGNLGLYGIGGLIVPFIGIKAIDLAVGALGLV